MMRIFPSNWGGKIRFGIMDLENDITTKIAHSGYSIFHIMPTNAGNGAYYLGERDHKRPILGHWDFRSNLKTHGPSTVLKAGYFRNSSLLIGHPGIVKSTLTK